MCFTALKLTGWRARRAAFEGGLAQISGLGRMRWRFFKYFSRAVTGVFEANAKAQRRRNGDFCETKMEEKMSLSC